MGDATRSQPKCLTRLAGRTLLDWQLSALAAAGIERVGLVTGYCRELLEPHVRDSFHNERWRETNMVASLLCADSWLRETPVIVSYSDIVYTADHVRALLQAKAAVALTYDPSGASSGRSGLRIRLQTLNRSAWTRRGTSSRLAIALPVSSRPADSTWDSSRSSRPAGWS